MARYILLFMLAVAAIAPSFVSGRKFGFKRRRQLLDPELLKLTQEEASALKGVWKTKVSYFAVAHACMQHLLLPRGPNGPHRRGMAAYAVVVIPCRQ